ERRVAGAAGAVAAESAGAAADRRLAEFQAHRDGALFHGTLFTNLTLAENLQATRAAARAGLALFGLPGGGGASQPSPAPLDTETAEGCYELLLLLADAVAEPLPGLPAEKARAQARQAPAPPGPAAAPPPAAPAS